MFSFLLAIMSVITRSAATARRARTRAVRGRRENELKWKHKLGLVPPPNKNKKDDKDKSSPSPDGEGSSSLSEESKSLRLRSRVLAMLATVVAFIETLPLFLTIMFYALIAICIIALIVAVFLAVSSILNMFQKPPVADVGDEGMTPVVEAPVKGGKINWTDEQLKSAGQMLTDFEKNIYRLGILYKKTITGSYGNDPLFQFNSKDLDTGITIMLGVISMETTPQGQFYPGGADAQKKDIMTIPSTMGANSSNYGVLGLNTSETLEAWASSNVVAKITSTYKPSGSYSYVAQYYPYAAYISAKYMEAKWTTFVSKQQDQVEKVMDDWGIKAHRDDFAYLANHFLMQAQYHGAQPDEYAAYLNFWAAIYCATSDKDEERSFDKWGIKTNWDNIDKNTFDESNFRKAVIGKTGNLGYNLPSGVSTSSQLQDGGGYTLLLNGQEIKGPLWKYLGEKYSGDSKFAVAWNGFKEINDHGVGVRTLNFHYGFNSYLQGLRYKHFVELHLVGTFNETPGKSQAVFADGQTTEAYIADWVKKSSSNAAYVSSLSQYFGTSAFLRDENNTAKKNGYVDEVWGVPFYAQGAQGNLVEDYNGATWYPGGGTFSRNGCMIFANAYVVSALTGSLVNPPEMAVIMASQGALGASGIVMGEMPSVYKDLGLTASIIGTAGSDSFSSANFDKIESTLKAGGLAVVRVKKGTFTDDEHFFVLTKVEEVKGTLYYTVYTSSRYYQSMPDVKYTRQQLLNEGVMWQNAILISKGSSQ